MIGIGRLVLSSRLSAVLGGQETNIDGVEVREVRTERPPDVLWRSLVAEVGGGGELIEFFDDRLFVAIERKPDTGASVERIAMAVVADHLCVVATPGSGTVGKGSLAPSRIVRAWRPAPVPSLQPTGIRLRSGIVTDIVGTWEHAYGFWTIPALSATLEVETTVVDTPEPPELAAGAQALAGVTDLASHGVEVDIIALGARSAAGLVGEELRYVMGAPDGDIYQAIWGYAGLSQAPRAPAIRIELTSPKSFKQQAELAWGALIRGCTRET